METRENNLKLIIQFDNVLIYLCPLCSNLCMILSLGFVIDSSRVSMKGVKVMYPKLSKQHKKKESWHYSPKALWKHFSQILDDWNILMYYHDHVVVKFVHATWRFVFGASSIGTFVLLLKGRFPQIDTFIQWKDRKQRQLGLSVLEIGAKAIGWGLVRMTYHRPCKQFIIKSMREKERYLFNIHGKSITINETGLA